MTRVIHNPIRTNPSMKITTTSISLLSKTHLHLSPHLSQMATSFLTSTPLTSSFLPLPRILPIQVNVPTTQRPLWSYRKQSCLLVRAAKLPEGMVLPKAEPKFKPAFLGFTYTAEIWNSRACMIGLIGTFIVELILNKGILQMIGVEVGKGLDIPL